MPPLYPATYAWRAAVAAAIPVALWDLGPTEAEQPGPLFAAWLASALVLGATVLVLP